MVDVDVLIGKRKSILLKTYHCTLRSFIFCYFLFFGTFAQIFFFLQNITYYTKLKLFTTEYLQYGTYATRYYYYIRYYYNLARGTNVNNAYKIYETF